MGCAQLARWCRPEERMSGFRGRRNAGKWILSASIATIGITSISQLAQATSYTWTGASPGTGAAPKDGSWNASGNWVGGLPTSSGATELIFGGSGGSGY